MKKIIKVPISEEIKLERNCLASAGPNANAYGMRKKYWGTDAYIIRCGNYIYRVSEEIYNYYKFN